MTDSREPADQPDPEPPTKPGDGDARKPPSLVVGLSLLVMAAVLIVVVLIQPSMSSGLKATIGVVAVLVVAALLGYAFALWKTTQRGGRGQ